MYIFLKVKVTSNEHYNDDILNKDDLICVYQTFQGSNITLANGKGYARETTDHIERVTLTEDNWYRMKEGRRSIDLQPVSKQDFMTVLYSVDRILIRATYHSAQKSSL